MRFWMHLGWLLGRFWNDLGANLGGNLGPKSLQKRLRNCKDSNSETSYHRTINEDLEKDSVRRILKQVFFAKEAGAD